MLPLRYSLSGFGDWALRPLQKCVARKILQKMGDKDHGRESLCVDVWFFTSMDASPSLKQDTWVDMIEGKEQMNRGAQADPSLCFTEQQEQVVVRSRGTGTVGSGTEHSVELPGDHVTEKR